MTVLEGSNVSFGFGSDSSEEPAVQDVEPVTLDFVVVPELSSRTYLWVLAG